MNFTTDENGVRYSFVSDYGNKDINWLFLPGGPGADSRYLLSLIDSLDIPGKVWLVDLPGNGDNPAPKEYDYHNWLTLLPSIVTRFPNCSLVGHSLGGMLPLLCPKLEEKLLGLVIINSAPCLWTEESARLLQKYGFPDLPEKQFFLLHKTQEAYNNLLQASLSYFFNEEARPKGKSLFTNLPFPVQTMLTVFGIMQEIHYKAQWIPQKVPTLLIGGDQDYITPFSLFEEDLRFNRQNIQKTLINGCGHWCWIEKPEIVRSLFSSFVEKSLFRS